MRRVLPARRLRVLHPPVSRRGRRIDLFLEIPRRLPSPVYDLLLLLQQQQQHPGPRLLPQTRIRHRPRELLHRMRGGTARIRRLRGTRAAPSRRLGREHQLRRVPQGGGDCATWAGIYTEDAVAMGLTTPANMPLTISDGNNDFRDAFFTPPYPHPSCEFAFDGGGGGVEILRFGPFSIDFTCIHHLPQIQDLTSSHFFLSPEQTLSSTRISR